MMGLARLSLATKHIEGFDQTALTDRLSPVWEAL